MSEVLTKSIRGSGGSGGGGGGSEAENTLRSTAVARIIDAISEGEIEGLANGEHSIYLDGVPLKNSDGSSNFTGVSYQYRPGTQSQTYIEDFPAVENEVPVNVQVKKDQPVTRTVTNTSVDTVFVKISLPALYQVDKSGNTEGSSVRIAIDLQDSSSGFVEVVRDTIGGKTMNTYERAYKVPLTGTGPWNIRVRRITPDSTKSNLQNTTNFASFTEVIDAKLSYPNTALVGLRFDAAQFSNVPNRTYDVKLLRVKVPTNYDPETRLYSGVWDGTFKIAWTNNPAWCLYDLLTSERYGLGTLIDQALVDKWGLYKIGRYCDGLVPDGFGGMEPRFTLNCYLQSREDAFKLINDLCSVFRGMAYWSSGSVFVTQDSPSDPVALFTNANCIDGTFTYSGSSMKARHTVALVTWSDQAEQGVDKVEYVEDTLGIARLGVVQTEVLAFGCTSRAQAHRLGRWILNSEREEAETVTFRTALEGSPLAPGSIIKVRDNNRYASRSGGRILSGTVTTINLDAPVTIESGSTYKLSVMLPNGSMEERTVTTAPGTTSALVVSPLTYAPQSGAIWILTKQGVGETRNYRVTSISQTGPIEYEVTGLLNDSTKYANIDFAPIDYDSSDANWETAPGTGSNVLIPAPTNLKAVVSSYLDAGVPANRLALSWKHIDGLAGWDVEYAVGKNNPVFVGGVREAQLDLEGIRDGYYTWRVRATGVDGRNSAWTAGTAIYVGANNSTSPQTLVATPGFLQIRLDWTFPADATRIVGTEVWCAVWDLALDKPTVGAANKIATLTGLTDSWSHTDLDPRHRYVYWIRFRLSDGSYGDMYPTDGLVGIPKVDVSDAINSMDESFRASQFYQDLTSRIDTIELPSLDGILEQIGMGDLENAIEDIDSLLLQQVLADNRIESDSKNSVALLQNSFTQVATDLSAEVTQRELLLARLENISQDGTPTGKTLEALLLENKTAQVDGDQALASSVNAVVARLNNSSGTGKTVEAIIAETKQAVVDETTARSAAIDSVSARLQTGGDVYQSIVQVQNIAQAKSANYKQATAPTSPVLNDLWIDTANGNKLKVWNGSAWVASDNATIGTTATQVTSLQSRVDSVSGSGVSIEQKFTTTASDITGLKGQWTVKIDNNGNVSGIGLASEAAINGSPSSTFAVNANKFVISAPGAGGDNANAPFYYLTTPTTINGKYFPAGAYLKKAFIESAAIEKAHIVDASVDTIKIAGNAVSATASASGSGSAGVYMNCADGGQATIIGVAGSGGSQATGGSPPSSPYMSITINGVTYTSVARLYVNTGNSGGESPSYYFSLPACAASVVTNVSGGCYFEAHAGEMGLPVTVTVLYTKR